LQPLDDLLGDLIRAPNLIDTFDEDRKLVVAASGDQVARTQFLAKTRPHFEEKEIGHVRAKPLAHILESVEVDQHKRKRRPGAATLEQDSLEPASRRLFQ
jgi:hypothetical protein